MNAAGPSFQYATHDDLITGNSPWGDGMPGPRRESLDESFHTDVAIIGGGITGALIAENLSGQGYSVAVLDRERVGLGSTRASTAMLQWEIDTPLIELAGLYGFEAAADIYRRSFAAVAGLRQLVTARRIRCALTPRDALYLAAEEMGEKELAEEFAMRRRAGLPGQLLNHDALKEQYGIDRAAAILSPGSAQADPLLLCWWLLTIAANRKARIIDADAIHFHDEGERVVVETTGPHVVEAKHVVLATGYAMPHFIMPRQHEIRSSFALATVPQAPERLWRDGALIWEAAEPYSYMRLTADNRIVIGGEDEDVSDPQERDAMLGEKTETLRQTLARLIPGADPTVSHAWCGAFGETSDGLPLIGRVPGARHVYAAYGYGGNGITFSYMASRMIAALMKGEEKAWFDNFALDRPDLPES